MYKLDTPIVYYSVARADIMYVRAFWPVQQIRKPSQILELIGNPIGSGNRNQQVPRFVHTCYGWINLKLEVPTSCQFNQPIWNVRAWLTNAENECYCYPVFFVHIFWKMACILMMIRSQLIIWLMRFIMQNNERFQQNQLVQPSSGFNMKLWNVRNLLWVFLIIVRHNFYGVSKFLVKLHQNFIAEPADVTKFLHSRF